MTVVKTGPDGENSVKLGRNRWTLPTTTKPSKEKLGKKTNARAQPSSMNQLTIDRRLDASVCVASTNELHTWPCVCVCVCVCYWLWTLQQRKRSNKERTWSAVWPFLAKNEKPKAPPPTHPSTSDAHVCAKTKKRVSAALPGFNDEKDQNGEGFDGKTRCDWVDSSHFRRETRYNSVTSDPVWETVRRVEQLGHEEPKLGKNSRNTKKKIPKPKENSVKVVANRWLPFGRTPHVVRGRTLLDWAIKLGKTQ